MCVPVWGVGRWHVYVCKCWQRPEAWDPLELGLQAIVSHLMWGLGADSFSGRAVRAPPLGAISPAPFLVF